MDALKYRSEPRYNHVANFLRDQIKSGELKPGDRLPSFPAMRAQGVSQPTLDRVHRILEHEGLVVREARRGVFVTEPRPDRATRRLAVMTHSLVRQNPYYAQLLSGVQEEAHRRKAEVLLLLEDSQANWEGIDGCVVVTATQYKKTDTPEAMPTVTLMYTFEGIASVTIDDSQGIRDSVNHLLQLGHRRIAFLTSAFNYSLDPGSRDRLAAYQETLAAAGIDADPRWARSLDALSHYTSFVNLGRVNMEWWLHDNWKELGCTALLAQNDETAIGAMQALADAGIKVPDEVSVIGFDGTEMGLCVRPNLSTVNVPLAEVGAAGVAMMLEPDDGPGKGRASIALPVSFQARESTVPCCRE